MAQIVETVPFNYSEIRAEVDKKFAEAGFDTSPASNVSQLSNIIAYATSMLNAGTALNINETLLSYATKRENIVEVAKNFSYEPYRARSYCYNLTLKFTQGAKYYIPKWSKFTANGKSYWSITDDVTFTPSAEKDTYTIIVKEGEFFHYEDDPASLVNTVTEKQVNNLNVSDYYFDIPYINVEEDGLEVFCSYYDRFNVFHERERFIERKSTFIETDDLDSQTEYIRRDNSNFKTPRIYFKYAGTGTGLPVGSTVYVNVLTTSGPNGEMTDMNKPQNIKCEFPGVSVIKAELASIGQAEEDVESIRENAPLLYNTSNRLVTADDYRAFCKRDSRIRDAFIWGGNDEFPKSPGHVWFSFLPSTNKRNYDHDDLNMSYKMTNSDFVWDYDLTELNAKENEIRANEYYNSYYMPSISIRSYATNKHGDIIAPGIFDVLESKSIPTLIFHHRHPIYCEFNYKVDVLKYTLYDDQPKIRSEIFEIVDNAFRGDDAIKLEKFGTEYFNSSLIKRIDQRVTDASGFNMHVQNRLVLNAKTMCTENQEIGYKDIYIPLGIPLEDYFDEEGYLRPEVLPNIDTENFARYKSLADFPYHSAADIYVDWSWLKQEREDKVTQKYKKLIVAPIFIKHRFRYDFNQNYNVSRNVPLPFQIAPDGFEDKKDFKEYTFDRMKVWKRERGSPITDEDIIKYDPEQKTGWYLEPSKMSKLVLAPDVHLTENSYIECEYHGFCGFYYLFNSYKKEILVHLFVDGRCLYADQYPNEGNGNGGGDNGYNDEATSDNTNDPEAQFKECYLYTNDEYYLNSRDDYYLVTEARSCADLNNHYGDVAGYIPKSFVSTSYRKNGSVTDGTAYTQPQSYLYTTDMKYLYSFDRYYLTTEGYIQLTEEVDEYTGPLVRMINSNMYKRSVLKGDLFMANRYLDLRYPSMNFKLIRNVIPCLRNFEFTELRGNSTFPGGNCAGAGTGGSGIYPDGSGEAVLITVNPREGSMTHTQYQFKRGVKWSAIKDLFEIPKRTDYDFTFFSLSSTDPEKIQDDVLFNTSATIYANYKYAKAVIHVVQKNPTTGETKTTDFKYDSGSIWLGIKDKITQGLDPIFGDYKLTHISEDENGIPVNDARQFCAGDYTLHAVYAYNMVEITCDTKGGTEVKGLKVVKGTSWKEIEHKFSEPELVDNYFKGWSLEFDGRAIDPEYKFTADKVTIYAIYEGYQYCLVRIDTLGGKPQQSPIRCKVGTKWSEIKDQIVAPSKTDYVFKHWSTEPVGLPIDDEFRITY